MERMDVDEVLGTFETSVREKGMPSAAVLVVEYENPEDGELYLWAMRDTKSAIWKHLGMVSSVSDDLRRQLQLSDSGGEDYE